MCLLGYSRHLRIQSSFSDDFYLSSYIESISDANPEYYEGDQRLPIFCRVKPNRKRLFTTEDAVTCLLKPKLNTNFICKKVPTAINHNVCFIVDSSELDDSDDLLSDDMGVWRNNRVDSIMIAMNSQRVIKRIPRSSTETPSHTLKRVYRVHGMDKSFKKIIYTIHGELYHISPVYLVELARSLRL